MALFLERAGELDPSLVHQGDESAFDGEVQFHVAVVALDREDPVAAGAVEVVGQLRPGVDGIGVEHAVVDRAHVLEHFDEGVSLLVFPVPGGAGYDGLAVALEDAYAVGALALAVVLSLLVRGAHLLPVASERGPEALAGALAKLCNSFRHCLDLVEVLGEEADNNFLRRQRNNGVEGGCRDHPLGIRHAGHEDLEDGVVLAPVAGDAGSVGDVAKPRKEDDSEDNIERVEVDLARIKPGPAFPDLGHDAGDGAEPGPGDVLRVDA